MSEDKEMSVADIAASFKNDNSNDSLWVLLLFAMLSLGWNSPENPKINELEKKVARLEGQMSMIGGKNL